MNKKLLQNKIENYDIQLEQLEQKVQRLQSTIAGIRNKRNRVQFELDRISENSTKEES
jgi:predicted  nucleic acid-binding Zn-ribbon protein